MKYVHCPVRELQHGVGHKCLNHLFSYLKQQVKRNLLSKQHKSKMPFIRITMNYLYMDFINRIFIAHEPAPYEGI
jgi:hypothetical protein